MSPWETGRRSYEGALDLPELRADLESRLGSWYRAQVEYYEDRSRHAAEYPPLPE